MEILQTAHIEHWPEDVMLGTAVITGELSLELLTDEETREYHSFTNEARKAEYLTARHLFQYLMKATDTDMDSSSTLLLKHEGGKPYVKHQGGTGYVSFSHSRDRVFCAISHERDIGVDVEKSGREIKEGVVKRILNEEELNTLKGVEPVILWTIKEAVVKCLGTGLRTNLNELTILKNDKKGYSVRFNDEKLFEICSFEQLNHQIALAY